MSKSSTNFYRKKSKNEKIKDKNKDNIEINPENNYCTIYEKIRKNF